MTKPSLNLIGPGRLGQTLARLWHDAGVITVQQVLARQNAHADAACRFIGAGAAADWHALQPAKLTLIATPDAAIEQVANQLAASGVLRAGDVVIHSSGALPSALMAACRRQGALLASVHPLKSFADAASAITDFAGCYCACEGDAAALALVGPLFDAIGARRFQIDTQQKALYHAAAVLACNDLVALMEAALRCMAAAGVERPLAWQALRPLIDGTLRNLDRSAPAQALTGPVARGDTAVVRRQLAASSTLDPAVGDAYRALAVIACQLAEQNGNPAMPELKALLDRSGSA